MNRRIIHTKDGSHTIEVPDRGMTYHSRHGAIDESMHVYIRTGLHFLVHPPHNMPALRIFEMGFGTGLNALLTAIAAAEGSFSVHYTALEQTPLPPEEAFLLNYSVQLGHSAVFKALHRAPWEEDAVIHDTFTLRKEKASLQDHTLRQPFHLIYYDAFAPSAQPELWTAAVFKKLYDALLPGGILVTYCSKSVVRRAMTEAGFNVKKAPGPWGKREIVRAHKEGCAQSR